MITYCKGTDIIDSTQEHDEYKMGEFKDDQMQRITGAFALGCNPNGRWSSGAFTDSASGNTNGVDYERGGFATFEFNSARVTRTAWKNGVKIGPNITRGRRKGVMYLIKVL